MYATRDAVTGATQLWWTNGSFLLTAAIPAAATEPTEGQVLVDLGEPRGVRIVGLDGEVEGDAPAGSLGPMAAWSPAAGRHGRPTGCGYS